MHKISRKYDAPKQTRATGIFAGCAETVNNLRISLRIIRVRLSTEYAARRNHAISLWVSTPIFTRFAYNLYTQYSTMNFTQSPQLVSLFSPLSTVPITNTTFSKKENNN